MGWWIARDAAGLVGVGLIAYGAHQAYAPLGFIVPGAFLLGYVLLYVRRGTSE